MASKHAIESVERDFFPASPTTEYINSSVLSLSILCVFDFEVPLDDSQAIPLLKNVFLPINPQFSSVLHRGENGAQKWERVQVNLEDHVKIPHFPLGLKPNDYDDCLHDYLSKIAMEKLPEDRPLWEIHLFKYPTRHAEANVVFKLHHALGDGFSLMGALFSCLKRADNPSLPLAFPSAAVNKEAPESVGVVKKILERVFGTVYSGWVTASDFTGSLLQSTVLEDDTNAIRSGRPGVEFEPVFISTVTLSLKDIRQVKSKIGGTVNDVAVGTVSYAIHLYNQRMSQYPSGTRMTALVLLNTRMTSEYQSVSDMLRAKTWGNHFTFLHIPIHCCNHAERADPLAFIHKAKKTIKRKKNSLAVFLTGIFLQTLRSIRGPESVNDVAVGSMFYGIQLYKQRTCQNSNGTRMTALVLLNTRMVNRYQSVDEMLRQKTWGNRFTFLNVPIPSSNNKDKPDPLSFLLKAKKTIKRKKHSMAIFLTGRLLQTLRRFKGPEAVSSFIHTTMKNTSTGISYLNGPIEKMELGRHPIKSFYFIVVGVPHSLAVTMVSYMGNLKVVFTGEKGFIDSQLLVSCMKEAFDKVYKEACGMDGM